MIKIIGGSIAFAGFLVASILMFIQARHYQVVGQPMPNWKGGFMAPSDGYIIGLAFLFLSIASLVMVVKHRQHKK